MMHLRIVGEIGQYGRLAHNGMLVCRVWIHTVVGMGLLPQPHYSSPNADLLKVENIRRRRKKDRILNKASFIV
jgi:hypothetical protein